MPNIFFIYRFHILICEQNTIDIFNKKFDIYKY